MTTDRDALNMYDAYATMGDQELKDLRARLGAVPWLSLTADEALTAYKIEALARVAWAKRRANPKGN
jgi:hypothetical protein